ncbi:hypothetical protein P175DRAFT_0498461 [Aspergillus ochraceoroseus IBT 24754]|uniref:Uncharacterized protein n=2 Tax=Aspergillus ochraceoroseus TaxID=138278 RepID=A0A2T5M9Y7_9EURO|nr:uncharacterized protein P175DRAFT_0498461 [Aspergillus ochraceoroseus IBT 24754]KKK24673.1 hypothetical protein AOCH_007792 [Aspergillus ochraceoroseus]PTU25340.1 hypothetical protein P175DRAFT_0498461 [Aspergillus ochraceoroseus IBT 24754]
MQNPKLYVVFYRPQCGNYHSWAPYVDDEDALMIFEVVGQHPDFQRNVVNAKAEKSKSFLGKEYVAVISKADIEKIKEVASTVPVDNETVEWDCQDYVLEILDKLEDEFILEEYDEDYREARRVLREKKGCNYLIVSLYRSYFQNMPMGLLIKLAFLGLDREATTERRDLGRHILADNKTSHLSRTG